jgi:hypothetical protein
MAWGTIRKATDDDRARISAAAEKFCARHQIGIPQDWSAEAAIAFECYGGAGHPGNPELRRYWKRVIKRILGNGADGIAYGYVGYVVPE